MNWLKKHKILTVVGVLVLVMIIGSAASGGGANTAKSDNNKETSSAKNESTVAKIGEPANDGRFEFVVRGMECGKSSVGSEYLSKSAQGQYCVLNVTVKNIGDEKQSLFSSNQKLLDKDGKEYSADDTATLYAAPQGTSWYNDINPGNSVEGAIIFDVPKGTMPIKAKLHDSAFSNGVEVKLQ